MAPRSSRKGSFQIPHHYFDGGLVRKLGASNWAVYCCLLRHADRAGHCYPTESHLCRLTELGRTTVSQSVQQLARSELLTVTKERVGARRQHRNHYCLRIAAHQGFYQLIGRDLIDRGTIAAIGVSAWMVYTCLPRHTHTKKRNACHPSQARLAELTGLSESTVGTAIKRLCAAQMIRVTKQRRAEGHTHNVYYLMEYKRSVVLTGTPPANSEPTYVQNLQVKNPHSSTSAAEVSDAPELPEIDSSPWGASGVLALGVSRHEQVFNLLCLHLGGKEKLQALLDHPSPAGLARTPWLHFSYKTIQRLVFEGWDADFNQRQQNLIHALDQHLLQRHQHLLQRQKRRSATEVPPAQQS